MSNRTSRRGVITSKWGAINKATRSSFVVLFLIASIGHLIAKAGASRSQTDRQPPPGQDPRPGQPQRGAATREFLGLGPAPDPVAAERGEKLYGPNCAFCHGARANGATGPDLVRSPLVLHDEKGELIGPLLREGRTDKGMPSFPSLSQEQISDLTQFLHMRVELSANRGLYKVENIVTGDAKAGEAYFNGAGHCNECHSPTGDLAHVGSRLQPVDLQSAFLWPGSTNRERRRSPGAEQVTVITASRESVLGTLKRLDDFDVSIHDTSGAYRSWPRDEVRVEFKDELGAHRRLLDQYRDADIHNLLAYLVTLK